MSEKKCFYCAPWEQDEAPQAFNYKIYVCSDCSHKQIAFKKKILKLLYKERNKTKNHLALILLEKLIDDVF